MYAVPMARKDYFRRADSRSMRLPSRAYKPARSGDRKGGEHVEVIDDVTSPADTTADLVAKAQGGDRSAFAELYVRHYGGVFRLAHFYLSRESAEDATSETFVRAWRALPRYRDTGAPFSSWLYGIARHVVKDAGRAARRLEFRADMPDTPGENGSDVADRLTLAAAMQRLPKHERQVLELKFFAGLGNEEISTAIGKSPGAVNAIRWRALKRMRGFLEDV